MLKKSLEKFKGLHGSIMLLGTHVGLTITLDCVRTGMTLGTVRLVTVVSICMTGRTIRLAGNRNAIFKGPKRKDGGESPTLTSPPKKTSKKPSSQSKNTR